LGEERSGTQDLILVPEVGSKARLGDLYLVGLNSGCFLTNHSPTSYLGSLQNFPPKLFIPLINSELPIFKVQPTIKCRLNEQEESA